LICRTKETRVSSSANKCVVR